MTRTIKVTQANTGRKWLIPISELHHSSEIQEEDLKKEIDKLMKHDGSEFTHQPSTVVWFTHRDSDDWDRILVKESIEDIEYMINTPYSPTSSE
jgi:predicted oxidoreductase (fatty acid repression mutant protein)